MSRGGRGGFRGGKRGPDLSWDDEESIAPSQPSNRPAPLFPVLHLKTPKPLDLSELSSVRCYLNIRDRIRNGLLYSTLDQSSYTDDKGQVDRRAGFDPFNDQEKYSTRFHKKRRTMPDLSGREYSLHVFPQELWTSLDPKRRHPIWKTLEPDVLARLVSSSNAASSKKRKRAAAAALKQNDEEVDDELQEAAAADDDDDDDDDDVVAAGGRRKPKTGKTRRDDLTTKKSKQKRGLEAEDDFPDAENEDEGEGEGSEEGEPQDSEFSESDDGSGDDYNAEQYFDGGDDDDFGDDGGGGGGDDEPSY